MCALTLLYVEYTYLHYRLNEYVKLNNNEESGSDLDFIPVNYRANERENDIYFDAIDSITLITLLLNSVLLE